MKKITKEQLNLDDLINMKKNTIILDKDKEQYQFKFFDVYEGHVFVKEKYGYKYTRHHQGEALELFFKSK